MAKQSGLAFGVIVDNSAGAAKTISNDITNLSFSTPRGEQDITGLDKSGMERLLLLADGKVTFNGVFNQTADMSHDVFKTVPSTSVVRTVTLNFPGGAGQPKLAMEMLFSDYAITRAANGALTWSATGSLADGTVPTWSTQ